ncbi:PREDICTED: rab escort protein 1 [Lupinus angustifolius]|uniref:rab escort protein 1 n=1 Tax=Lupinus angustifolius TaxID=3871 RepID=UPI00092EB2E2|nr:PREDICTED: rab escort protein 1 [Lupinus angustifolius]
MSNSEDTLTYPPIDPDHFDLIIVGTGLSESVIAAAASAVGKTVLHLDHNSFYGSHFASLSLEELASYLNSHSLPALPSTATTTASNDDPDHVVVDLIREPLYSDVEIVSRDSDDEDVKLLRENSRKFNVDLGGPRALFSAGKSIDLLLKSGAAQYLEFKGIDESLVYQANEGLVNVPDSRGAIFRDKSLSLKEKNQLMRFFKLVQQHLAVDDGQNESGEGHRISEEDLESPFVSFLDKMRLPPKIKSIILYAIAMVDYDQDNNEVCKDLLKTKDGIDRLAQYSSSVGRFPNAPGALLYPIYGEGELPQAFCRRAAVKGCIYVLRMPVISVLMDKVTGFYKGVRLASGQNLYSDQLILDPSITISSPLSSFPRDFPTERLQLLSERDIKGMVARGICITRSSIKPDVSNLSMVYPPRSLYPEQVTSIRALQIGSNLAVCPGGVFVLYLSTLCTEVDEGKKLLKAAMDAHLSLPVTGNSESIPFDQSDGQNTKPIVIWSAFYIQNITIGKLESISSTPTPDGNLSYNDLLDAAEKLFSQMYPQEEFFPKTTSPEDTIDDDDNGITLES